MAKKKSGDELLVGIGLDLSELDSDFAMADKTVKENLARFNRETNLVRLRMQIDTAGLDPVKDKAKILELQQKALTEQLKIQSDRVKILTAEYNHMLQSMDKSSVAAQKAEASLLREQLAAKKLEAELNKVAKEHQQLAAPKGMKDIFASFGDKIGTIDPRLGAITTSIRSMEEVAGEAKVAMSEAGTVMAGTFGPASPVIAGSAAVVAALTAVVAAGIEVEKTLINIARPAIAAGDSIYVLSRRMAEGIPEAAAFNTTMKAIGSDTATVLGGLDRLSKAWLTAGEGGNAATRALQQFGATLTDENGNLLSYDERMQQLSKAFAAAKASGQQAQLQTLLFKNGMGDLVVAIEDYADVQKQVDEQLTKSKFGNPQLAHDLQTQVHLLDMQTAQLGSVFSQAFMPVAQELLPLAIEQIGTLTKILNDNKDIIEEVGDAVKAVFGGMGSLVSGAIKAVDALSSEFRELRDNIQKLEDIEITPYVNDENIKTYEDYVKAAHPDYDANDLLNPDQQAYMMKGGLSSGYEAEWNRLLEKRKEMEAQAQKEIDEQRKAANSESIKMQSEAEIADLKKAATARVAAEKMISEAAIAASQERIKVINDEYSEIVRAAASGEGDVYSAVEKWQDELNSEYANQAQKRIEIIQQEYDAKIALAGSAEAVELEKQKQAKITEIVMAEERRRQQAVRDSNERTKQYLRDAADIEYNLTHSSLEKSLHDVQRWKEAQMEKATTAKEVAAIISNAAAKEAKAFEDEVNRIKDLNKSLEEKIFEKTHSQYQNDLYKLQNEVYDALAKGADQSLVQQYYNIAKREIEQKRLSDKSGEYAKRPAGQGWDVIDFTQKRQPNFSPYDNSYVKFQRDNAEALARSQLGLSDSLQKTTQQLQALKGFDSIVNGVRANVPAPVNPNITVNVDLGGAYVFDDAMKTQLTNDVAKEVAGEVTAAVKNATTSAGMSIAG